MIISLHIPKTGGSSFGNILKSVYKEKLWVNYDRQWSKSAVNNAKIPDNMECFHGHFEFDAFEEMFPLATKITWLRDPVERTISLYNHIMHRPDVKNDLIMKIYEQKPSLLEFSRIAWVKNHALIYLGEAKPSDFAFIGFVDSFSDSLKICSKLLGWSFLPSEIWINKSKKTISQVPEDVKKSIRLINQDELDWIQEARRIFNENS